MNILPHYHPTHTCIEDVIMTTSLYFNRGYKLMYLEAWNFNYISLRSDNSLKLNNRLYTGRGDYGLHTFQHGLIINNQKIFDHDSYILEIEEELDKQKPIGIDVDSFWCPWLDGFRKYHMKHFCLVIGINKKKELLYCLDPNITKDIVELPISNFYKGSTETYKFTKGNIINDTNAIRMAVMKAVNRIVIDEKENKRAVYSMKLFAKEIKDVLNLEEEINGYSNLQYVPLFMKLTYIGWARINFSIFLNWYFNEFFPSTSHLNIINELHEIGNKWIVIKNTLLKHSIVDPKKIDLNLLKKNIYNIAEREERVAHQILNIL